MSIFLIKRHKYVTWLLLDGTQFVEGQFFKKIIFLETSLSLGQLWLSPNWCVHFLFLFAVFKIVSQLYHNLMNRQTYDCVFLVFNKAHGGYVSFALKHGGCARVAHKTNVRCVGIRDVRIAFLGSDWISNSYSYESNNLRISRPCKLI